MSTEKQPSREPSGQPTDRAGQDARRDEERENALKYRENVNRVNRSGDVEIERALSGVRR
jgi:hypothetical protein